MSGGCGGVGVGVTEVEVVYWCTPPESRENTAFPGKSASLIS